MMGRTVDEVATVLAGYCLIEPVLFSRFAPGREQCIYCIPWHSAWDQADLFGRLLHETDSSLAMRTGLREMGVKYSALNLIPLTALGTIEFRMAPTYRQADELLSFWAVIDRLCRVWPVDETAEAVVDSALEFGPEGIAEQILGERLTAEEQEALEEADVVGLAQRLVHTEPREPEESGLWAHSKREPLPPEAFRRRGPSLSAAFAVREARRRERLREERVGDSEPHVVRTTPVADTEDHMPEFHVVDDPPRPDPNGAGLRVMLDRARRENARPVPTNSATERAVVNQTREGLLNLYHRGPGGWSEGTWAIIEREASIRGIAPNTH
jgi:hypothetical protein